MTPRNNKHHLKILVGLLCLAAAAVFLFKVAVLGFPLLPGTQDAFWDIEVRVDFVAHGKPVKVSLYIPKDTRRYVLVDENFISRGYGLTTARAEGNRQVTWSIRKAGGPQALYYRASVRRIKTTEPPSGGTEPTATAPGFQGAMLEAAEALLSEVQARSADLETLATTLIGRLNTTAPDELVETLLDKQPDMLRRMQTAAGLLSHAGIPARVVHGVQLEKDQREAQFIPWIQVYDQGLWRSFDPHTGEAGIPDDYLTWWRGDLPLVVVKGGEHVHTGVAVRLNNEAAVTAATARTLRLAPQLVEFSLFSLPLETQAVYQVLLLVPVGALVLVLMRNVIGFKTFGTFMPVLIALAFRETQLLWGILLFSVVVALGLAVRFYLEQLKLLLVPRLASVLIVVVLLMTGLSILSHKLDIQQGLSVALFPMVILTMTIERMSIVWEERGSAEALQQGIGSLAVAAIAYLVMSLPLLKYLVFTFPELLLVVLAATLLLGRYSGYRLVELRRFKAFGSGTT